MAEQEGSPDSTEPEAESRVEVEAPEARPEAQAITPERGHEDGRRLLRRSKSGVLSTISKRVAGWPFGSIAPYALDREGDLILFISTLAEHTKNIEADDRVSFLVQEPVAEGDVQAHARVTIMGRADRVRAEDVPDVRARYLERVPAAVTYQDAHDFRFYRLRPSEVRYIGGFGRIFWLDAARFRLDPAADPLAKMASGVVQHMNEDHAEALVLYCRAFKNFTPREVKMIGIDQYGFDVEADGGAVRFRFDFDEPVTPETVRRAVVDLVARARRRLEAPQKTG